MVTLRAFFFPTVGRAIGCGLERSRRFLLSIRVCNRRSRRLALGRGLTAWSQPVLRFRLCAGRMPVTGLSAPFRHGPLTRRADLPGRVGIPSSPQGLPCRRAADLASMLRAAAPVKRHVPDILSKGGREHAGRCQVGELWSWRTGTKGKLQGPALPLFRCTHPPTRPPQRIQGTRVQQPSAGRRGLALSANNRGVGREEILSRQTCLLRPACEPWPPPIKGRGMDLRAGPISKLKEETRPRPLRGTILGKAFTACAHDNDCVSPFLQHRRLKKVEAGKKKNQRTTTSTQACQPCRRAIVELIAQRPPQAMPRATAEGWICAKKTQRE